MVSHSGHHTRAVKLIATESCYVEAGEQINCWYKDCNFYDISHDSSDDEENQDGDTTQRRPAKKAKKEDSRHYSHSDSSDSDSDYKEIVSGGGKAASSVVIKKEDKKNTTSAAPKSKPRRTPSAGITTPAGVTAVSWMVFELFLVFQPLTLQDTFEISLLQRLLQQYYVKTPPRHHH